MQSRRRSGVPAGILLILVGLVFLSYQLMPAWWSWLRLEMSWPMIVAGVGVFMFFFGLLINAPGMAVPASIVTGIGGLLYWQNQTGNWDSWAYAWALIPGFVGIGVILAALLGEGKLREALNSGGTLLFISVVMFLIFGSAFGGLELVGPYWPALIILAGLWLFVRALIKKN